MRRPPRQPFGSCKEDGSPHASGLAHLTDAEGRLLMLKGGDGTWRLPGGPALPDESARDAMSYHVRRDLQLHVEPRFLLGVEPVEGTGSTVYLFACGTLQADDIARIRLPNGNARSNVVAYAFVDYPGAAEDVSPHEHQLITEAAATFRGEPR
ncbi:NUDIX hydrolase [Streptomyces sp. URMC 126]|uniref:NUDIX hydrolase n=1 Tax=Streptomyces sp. URMC 126 TaxID=3423401 RepID=UPI003F194DF5